LSPLKKAATISEKGVYMGVGFAHTHIYSFLSLIWAFFSVVNISFSQFAAK
jgi:hypothetical protein